MIPSAMLFGDYVLNVVIQCAKFLPQAAILTSVIGTSPN